MVEATDVGDLEVDETDQAEVEAQDTTTYQISYYPADITLKGYLDKYEDKQLVIPEFQRNYVWDQVRASKLIDSFLSGLPVPGVFLYKERNTKKLLVIDGQQRIYAAIRFFKGQFDERTFRLKSVSPKWEGKTFDELETSDQYELKDAVLRATVVQQLDPADDSSIYKIFERLNTGGMNLNPMEIRKCVDYSEYYNLLEALNGLEAWRHILGNKKLDKRLRDVELVLRLLALKERWEKYEKPMKRFLDRFMSDRKKLKPEALNQVIVSTRSEFERVVAYVLNCLGEKPFHLRGRLNYAVMDSCLVMAYEAVAKRIEDFTSRYEKLVANTEYIENVTLNTSDEKALSTRFKKAREILTQ
jgi:hypothetical protein